MYGAISKLSTYNNVDVSHVNENKDWINACIVKNMTGCVLELGSMVGVESS